MTFEPYMIPLASLAADALASDPVGATVAPALRAAIAADDCGEAMGCLHTIRPATGRGVTRGARIADALVAVLGADEEDARDAANLRRLCAAV